MVRLRTILDDDEALLREVVTPVTDRLLREGELDSVAIVRSVERMAPSRFDVSDHDGSDVDEHDVDDEDVDDGWSSVRLTVIKEHPDDDVSEVIRDVIGEGGDPDTVRVLTAAEWEAEQATWPEVAVVAAQVVARGEECRVYLAHGDWNHEETVDDAREHVFDELQDWIAESSFGWGQLRE